MVEEDDHSINQHILMRPIDETQPESAEQQLITTLFPSNSHNLEQRGMISTL